MGWLGESDYNCPECDGEGEAECYNCGSECECDYCDGTGWDPEQVDVAAFAEAEKALNQKMREAGCTCLTHEWVDRDTDTRLGRSGGEYGKVAVQDFLLDEPP